MPENPTMAEIVTPPSQQARQPQQPEGAQLPTDPAELLRAFADATRAIAGLRAERLQVDEDLALYDARREDIRAAMTALPASLAKASALLSSAIQVFTDDDGLCDDVSQGFGLVVAALETITALHGHGPAEASANMLPPSPDAPADT